MEERPHLNPHRDRELQVGRAADRFEAGGSTVKAARMDPVLTRGRMQALGGGAWRVFKDWRSIQHNPSAYGTYGKDRYRPPPVQTSNALGPGGKTWSGTPLMASNADEAYRNDPRYHYDNSGGANLAGDPQIPAILQLLGWTDASPMNVAGVGNLNQYGSNL